MQNTPEMSLEDAWRVTEAVKEAIEERGGGAAVAVVDPHGELLAFARADGCPLPSINNAINKAFTAARERTESANVGVASREEDFAITNFGDLRYTGWGGGAPIVVDGMVVGAVGVSGLPEETDIELARLGAAALTGS